MTKQRKHRRVSKRGKPFWAGRRLLTVEVVDGEVDNIRGLPKKWRFRTKYY